MFETLTEFVRSLANALLPAFAVLATLSTIACLALFVKKHRCVVVQTDGRGNATTNAYDLLGRLASVTDPLGATTHYAYDAAGNLASVTNALGVARVYEYDIRGNKIYEGGGTYPVSYAYDAYGAITNMTTYRAGGPGFVPAAGDITTWIYDEATGLLTSKLYPDGNGPAYTTILWPR